MVEVHGDDLVYKGEMFATIKPGLRATLREEIETRFAAGTSYDKKKKRINGNRPWA